MKRCKQKYIIAISILLVIVTLSLMLYEHYICNYKYNNDISLSQIKNQQYTEQKMEKLEKDIFAGNITVRQFIRRYKPQCIRKTNRGYYAVLMQDNNIMCFIFWDNKDNIYNIYKTAVFLPHNVLENSIEIGKSSLNDITKSDNDFFYYPISKMAITGHICSDGVLTVKYDSNKIVQSMEFYSNEEVESSSDYLLQLTPYILPQDKLWINVVDSSVS